VNWRFGTSLAPSLRSSISRGFVNTDPATRANIWGIYGQDTYLVSRQLTVNLAVRWDVVSQPVEKFNRQSNFDTNTGRSPILPWIGFSEA
jgi:outer membrane receptor protein involved in Fe transport